MIMIMIATMAITMKMSSTVFVTRNTFNEHD